MLHLDVGGFEKQRGRQVQRTVQARRAVQQAVGLGFGGIHEFFERLVGHLIVDEQHHRVGDQPRDRNEVVVGELDGPSVDAVDLGEP